MHRSYIVRNDTTFKSRSIAKGGKIKYPGQMRWKKHIYPPPVPFFPADLLLLASPTPFFGIYLEYERIEATPGLTDTVLLY